MNKKAAEILEGTSVAKVISKLRALNAESIELRRRLHTEFERIGLDQDTFLLINSVKPTDDDLPF